MRFQDLTGQKFGKWTVLERAINKTRGTYWKCECECGTVKDVAATTLKNGQSVSCGCYRKEAVSRFQQEDLTGYRFGNLTVVELSHVAKNRQCVWTCLCDCGQYTKVYASNLKRFHTLSCGCIGTSKGENDLAEILRNVHVNFEREYSFEDLISPKGGKLMFDFAIKNDDNELIGLIEYQGIQHRVEMPKDPHFGQLQRDYSDNAKKEYCNEHNIPLMEIWFDEPLMQAVQRSLKTIYNHANSVPRL